MEVEAPPDATLRKGLRRSFLAGFVIVACVASFDIVAELPFNVTAAGTGTDCVRWNIPPPSGVEAAPVCLPGATDAEAFLTASNGSSRTCVLDHRFRGSVHNMACIISIH